MIEKLLNVETKDLSDHKIPYRGLPALVLNVFDSKFHRQPGF